ncbi:Quad-[4Fe-4S] ferredoxin, HycB/HydN/HyfA family [hydrothermal vent metagenome]|uniref:Quad-[4Fe-4S] ferredoxin, HycB/HydN/HyfA family n=1 Tax=hydrothermal vent metagenome TaxID=652676 RepID=A0A3B1BWJ1_9ZZZZ
MAVQNRRDFLKSATLIGAGAAGLSAKKVHAEILEATPDDRMGVLVDTTVCIGCRSCEWACKEAHSLEAGQLQSYQEDRSVFEKERRPSDKALTVVNEYNVNNISSLPVDVKVQCMHCEDPACVASCIVNAFTKHKDGTVTWNTDKCIGCRYCMIACPFQIPVFEYSKAVQPNIMKCDFCYDRTKDGKLPACVDICPVEALTYGKRNELIALAKSRIKVKPEKYVNHIYGEYEVGGTSWLYLAGVDFSKLNFVPLGNESAPGVSREIQHGLFKYFVPPIAIYALLGGIMWLTKKRESNEEEI